MEENNVEIKEKKNNNVVLYIVIIGIIILVGIGIGYYFFNNSRKNNSINSDGLKISYYTHDDNKKFCYKNNCETEKLSEPDSTWRYYIKETSKPTIANENIMELESYLEGVYQGVEGVYLENDCEEKINEYRQNLLNSEQNEFIENYSWKCKTIVKKGEKYDSVTNEICGKFSKGVECLSVNSWGKVEEYYKKFENVGANCVYADNKVLTNEYYSNESVNMRCFDGDPNEFYYNYNGAMLGCHMYKMTDEVSCGMCHIYSFGIFEKTYC